ncbi:MAG: isochorismatase family cysteine hydrolase [Armatimonadota bacterium]|nr:isochorismatase family cysteine hydrolase [Armatimonadota bacterium]
MEPTVRNPFDGVIHAASPLRLAGDRVALLVVDMQYFDAHPDWGEGLTARRLGVLDAFDEYFEILREATPKIQQLLSLCRGKGIEVVHVRVAELTDDSRDAGWKQVVRGLAVPKTSKEAELLEEVAPIGDEIVISKSSSGAFATTNIDRILRNMGITTLLFTGTATGGCVESTARDAVDLGYDVVVVADACADSTRRAHDVALQRMAGAGIHVRLTADLLRQLAALPSVDRAARSGVLRAARCVPTTCPVGSSRRTPYSLIFPPAIEVAVEPSTSALLLVDVQHWTCTPDAGLGRLVRERGVGAESGAFYERVRSAVPCMQRLLSACRAAGVAVVHVRTVAHMMDGRDLSPKLRVRTGLPTPGSREAELLEEVAPRPGEIVLSKPASGVCTGTGLDEILRNVGVKTVILAGVSVDGSIEGSSRSLTDRGYALVLVPDACATYDEHLQQALWNMQTGIINVVSTETLTARLLALAVADAASPAT